MADVVLTQSQRDLLKQYRAEAFGYLTEIQAANENLKDVIEAAADGTGLEKKIISSSSKLCSSSLSKILQMKQRFYNS